MPLNFNYPKSVCNEANEIIDKEVLRWRDIIPWLAMCISLTEITEKNFPEWEYRVQVLNNGDYYLAYENKQGVNPPIEVLKKCIGFRTNVSTLPRKKWLNTKVIPLCLEVGISDKLKKFKLKP